MIDIWKDIAVESAAFYLGWGGFVIGLVFGFIVYRTNFCAMGSVSDFMSFGDFRRFRSWMMAGAVTIIGVTLVERAGIADMSQSMYVSSTFTWGGHVIGGLIFGIGMVFGGGCVSKNLVRAGGGDLRSLLVLVVIGITAFMTIGGLFGPVRVAVIAPMTLDLGAAGLADQRIGTLLAMLTGMAPHTAGLIAALLLAGAILVYCFADAGFRTSPSHLIAGLGVGLCVVAGWVLTGLTYDEFADNPTLISLTFARPSGDTLDYLMRFTAFGAPGFGVVTTAGALFGAFAAALSQKKFALTTFTDSSDTLRNLFGAVLMGIGGVVALGCTVGQGITGLSTLAMGSVLTLVFIVIGGIIGVKTIEALA